MRVIYKPQENTVGFEFTKEDPKEQIELALRSIPGLAPAMSAVADNILRRLPSDMKALPSRKPSPTRVNPNLSAKENAELDRRVLAAFRLLWARRNDTAGVFWKELFKAFHGNTRAPGPILASLKSHITRHAMRLEMDVNEIIRSHAGCYSAGPMTGVFLQRAFHRSASSS